MLEQGQLQRRSVKEALRASFSGRRGVGYIPPALERLRGAFLCVSCPSRHQGIVYGRLSAARAGSAARCPCRIRWWTWSGPLDGGRVAHTGCGQRGRTSGRKTWGRFRERGAMQQKLTSQCNTAANSWDCAPVAGGTLSLKEYGKGSTKKYVVCVCISCHE